MQKFAKLIPGFSTNLDTNGVHVIGKKKYDFRTITENECLEIIATGSKHIKKAKPKADTSTTV